MISPSPILSRFASHPDPPLKAFYPTKTRVGKESVRGAAYEGGRVGEQTIL